MASLSPERVRSLFGEEAEQRLANLGQLLLELEEARGDQQVIGAIFRELHSLKGSAAIAGLEQVSVAAHDLEEVVAELRNGQRETTPEVVDLLLAGTDRLSTLITNEPAPVVPAVPQASAPPAPSTPPAPPAGPATDVGRPAGPEVISSAPPQTAGDVVTVPSERLEELIRLVGEVASAHLRVGQMLRTDLGVDPASCTELNELARALNHLQDRAMRTQMVPISTVTDRLRRAARDLARSQGKEVRWVEKGVDTELDRGVLRRLSDSLVHLVRNAVDHGIEPPAARVALGKPTQGTLTLHAMQLGSDVIIAVTDDGRGIDVERVRARAVRQGLEVEGLTDDQLTELIFRPGFSTTSFVTDVSGRGVGLDVVRTNVEAARGRVEVRSELGRGAEVRVVVPITLAVLRCLLVEAGGQRFALPFHRVVLTQAYDPEHQLSAEGRPAVWADAQPVPLSSLARTLDLPTGDPPVGPVVVLTDLSHRHAFRVDRLAGQRDVVIKGVSRLIGDVPAVAGASVEPDGSILVVLDPPGLISRALRVRQVEVGTDPSAAPAGHRQRVLVVDDALTVRELQRGILERAGFDVRVAADGQQAMRLLAGEPSDLVLTDVDMPIMDGIALTEAIRATPALANVPVLILTSRSSDADRQRGLDAGADGYITKSGFDEAGLLAAVNRLLGGRS